jgi:hypothetical protein
MHNIELWQIFTSLGVPGLALGISYMLFKNFRWDFPKVPRGWVGPIIILFMLLTSSIILIALFLSAPSKKGLNNQKNPEINVLANKIIQSYQKTYDFPPILNNYYRLRLAITLNISGLKADEKILKKTLEAITSQKKELRGLEANITKEFSEIVTEKFEWIIRQAIPNVKQSLAGFERKKVQMSPRERDKLNWEGADIMIDERWWYIDEINITENYRKSRPVPTVRIVDEKILRDEALMIVKKGFIPKFLIPKDLKLTN